MGMATTAAQRYIRDALRALADLGWTPPPETEAPGAAREDLPEAAQSAQGSSRRVGAVGHDTAEGHRARTAATTSTGCSGPRRTSHDALRTPGRLRRRRADGAAVPDAAPRARPRLHRHRPEAAPRDPGVDRRRVPGEPHASRSFIQVAADQTPVGGRVSYRPEPAVTGDPTVRMGDYIPKIAATRDPYLNTQLSALDMLKAATTGALERAFVEHLDCLTLSPGCVAAWRAGGAAVAHA